MIEPRELHELDFWNLPSMNGNYLNISHSPAIILIPDGQGYIPYLWNLLQHKWTPCKLVTTKEELIAIIKSL